MSGLRNLAPILRLHGFGGLACIVWAAWAGSLGSAVAAEVPVRRVLQTREGPRVFEDVTSRARVQFAAMRWNRLGGVWQAELSVRNVGAGVLPAPLMVLVLDSRGTGGVVDGDNLPAAPSDEPRYWSVQTVQTGIDLISGAVSETRTISLSRLGNQAPTLETRVYARASQSEVDDPVAFTQTLDGEGMPLPAVRVLELVPGTSAVVESDAAAGAVSLGGEPGEFLWRFERPGHWPVWRRAILGSLAVTKVAPPRLTRRDGLLWSAPSGASTQELTNRLRGTVQRVGNLGPEFRVEVTELSQQSLPFPLPLGWSLQRAFWIDGTGAWEGTLKLEARPTDLLPEAGRASWLARWDTNGFVWRTVSGWNARGLDWVELGARSGGAFAWITADDAGLSVSTLPAGTELTDRVGPLVDLNGLTAVGRVLPGVLAASTNRAHVQAQALLMVSNRLGALPSGTQVRARIREQYRLADGSVREPMPYEVSLFLRRPASAGASVSVATAEWLLQPQLLLSAASLDEARIQAEILPEGAFFGGVWGGARGDLVRGGVRLSASAGGESTTRPRAAEIEVVPSGSSAEGTPPIPSSSSGVFEEVVRVRLLSGPLFAEEPATLRFDPAPADGDYVLGRLWYAAEDSGLEPVSVWQVRGGNVVEQVIDGASRWSGLDRSGEYVLVRSLAGAGVVRGQVRSPAGTTSTGGVISVVQSPWRVRANDRGEFLVVAPAGPTSLQFQHPDSGEISMRSLTVPAGGGAVTVSWDVDATAPQVVSVLPGDGAIGVPTLAEVAVRFSRAVRMAGQTPALEVDDASNEVVEGRLEWDGSGETLRWLPVNQFVHGSRYRIRISSALADRAGVALAGAREFSFTTVAAPPAPAAGAQLVSDAPDASGEAVVRGSAGMAAPRRPVIFVNETSGYTATGLSEPDGSFEQRLPAEEGDLLAVVVVHADGSRSRYPVGRQLFPDGSVGLFSGGGRITNRNENLQVILDVPAGAVQGRARFKVTPLAKEAWGEATKNTPPENGTLFGAFDLKVSGDPVRGKVRMEFRPDLSGLVAPPGKTVQDLTLVAAAFREFKEWIDGQERQVPVYEYWSVLQRETAEVRGPGLAQPAARPQSLLTAGYYALGNPSDARVMLFGNVYYSNTELIGQTVSSLFFGGMDAIPDTDIPVGGAVIRARAYSALNSRPFTLQGGELVSTSGEDGRFAFLVPEQTAQILGAGHALNATHPSFPRQFATSAAGARFDPIHPFGGGKIRFNREGVPDTSPPSITVSHAPATPAAGSTALVRVDAVDESGAVTPGLVLESVDPPGAAVTLLPATPGLWELSGPVAAKVVLRARGADPYGNAAEAVHVVRFGDAPAPPAPANDPLGPRVIFSQPDQDTMGIDLLAPLHLRFSEWVDPDLVDHPSRYLTLSPPAGPIHAAFEGSPHEVRLQLPNLQADTEYTLNLDGLRDLTGQYLDQDPSTLAPTNEPFVLRFRTAAQVLGRFPGISEGGGVVIQGAYAYVIDRADATLTQFDIAIPARPIPVTSRALPGPPRAIAMVRDYAYTLGFENPRAPGTQPGTVRTNDLLVVAGQVSGSRWGYLRVYDLSQPLVTGSHIASALITMDETALITRLNWSAPYLLLTENSAAAPQVHVINLQSLLLGDAYRALDRLVLDALPPRYERGTDANHDGDFVDAGDALPVQGTDSIEFVAGEEAVLSLAPNYSSETGMYQLIRTSRFVSDAIADGPASMAVLLTTGGIDDLVEATWRPIRTNRLTRPAAVRAFILGGDSPDTALPPVVTNAYVLEFPGYYPKRAIFVPVPLRRLMLVNLVSLDLSENSLRVVDASRPDHLTEVGRIELPVAEYGLLQGAELDPLGRVVLSLARGSGVDLLVLDPARLLDPVGSSGMHPAILGRLPGAGAGSLPFAVTDFGVTASSLRNVNLVSQSAPQLRWLPAGASTAAAASLVDGEERLRALDALDEALTLPVYGQGTNTSAGDVAFLWRVLMKAPGGAGSSVWLAAASLDVSGSLALGTNVALASFQNRVEFRRLSNDPLSPAFNAYLSEALVLVAGAVSDATVRRIAGSALPLRAGQRVRIGLPESLISNPVLGPYSGRGQFVSAPPPGAAPVRLGASLSRPVSVTEATLLLTSPVYLRTSVDALQGQACPGSAWLEFEHDVAAEITLRIDGRPLTGVTDETGRVLAVVTNVPFTAGRHRILVDAAHVPDPGEHAVELVATRLDGLDPARTLSAAGVLEHEIEMHHAFPIGHTMIQGVDLWDGHLALTTTDFDLPGRKLRLEFRRSYSSQGDASSGPLGAGWTHSYHVRLVHRLDCGTFTVVGGEGSGNAFTQPRPDAVLAQRYAALLPAGVPLADWEFFRPQIGYHSVLARARGLGDRLWFFTMEGLRHEFRSEGSLSSSGQTVYLLQEIREPHGNSLRFDYLDGDSVPATLDTVTEADALGALPKRGLRFEYQRVAGEERIVRVRGFNHQGSRDLMGLEMAYRYDAWGNLTNATRLGPSAAETRVQQYRYTPGADRYAHNLLEIVGPNGATTRYQYAGGRGLGGPYHARGNTFLPGQVPHETVTNVTHVGTARLGFSAAPDQSYGFRYDAANRLRWVREPRLVDGLGNAIPETRYTLNAYGATVRVEAPLGQVTEMRWATDHTDGSVRDALGNPVPDVVMTWRRDAEGQEQFFEYHDGRGNLTRERTVFAGSGKRPVTDAAGTTVAEVIRSMAYDATFNQRTNVVDAEGNVTRHEIDPATGSLLRTIDAEGHATRFTYEANGDLKGRHDPRGGVIVFLRRDPYGSPEWVRDPLGNDSFSRYDERGRLVESWDTFGHHSEFQYDALDRRTLEARRGDRAVRRGGPDAVATTVYDAAGLVLEQTDALGLVTRSFHDALNRAIRTEQAGIDPGDGSSQVYTQALELDVAGNLISETDARGVTRRHVYDALGRRVRTSIEGPFGGPTNADGILAQLAYDRVGNLTNEIDLHGASITQIHDGLYRVVEVRLPVPGAVVRTRYDREGNQRRVTDAAGMATLLEYDRIHRLRRVTNPVGHGVEYAYDASNNRTSTVDRVTGLVTRTTFDALQRETRVTQTGPGLPAEGYTRTIEYRDRLQEVVETNARGVRSVVRRDGLDRVVEQVADEGGLNLVSRMTFDAAGHGLTVVDPQNADVDVTHTYNRMGQRIATEYVRVAGESSPVLERWVLDPAGRVVAAVDRRGIERRHSFDNLGRSLRSELKESLSMGGAWLATATLRYEDGDRRVTVTDAGGAETSVESDALGRKVRTRDALGRVTQFRYGPVDLEEVIDPRGLRTVHQYDALHRPVRVQEFDAAGRLATQTSSRYEDAARRLVAVDRNGVEDVAERDALGRVMRRFRTGASVAATVGVDPAILGVAEYDGVGNVVRSVDGEGRTTQYQFDALNRVIRVEKAAGTAVAAATSFTYDAAGNLLEVKDARTHGGAFDVRHEYDARYRRTKTTDATAAVVSFAYDASGQVVAATDARGGVTRFTYDELGALLSVDETARATLGAVVPDAGVTRFLYDANRRRIAQQDATGALVTYALDVLGRLTNQAQHTLPGTLGPASRRGQSLGGGAPLTRRFEYDATGWVTNMVDARGQVVRLGYDHRGRWTNRTYLAHAEVDAAGAPRAFQPLAIDVQYDGNGNVLETIETKQGAAGAAVTERTVSTYDALNRLLTRTRHDFDDPVGRTLAFRYDLAGNRTNLVDADGRVTGYRFDARNLLTNVVIDAASASPLAVHYTWWPDGLPETVVLPGGTISLRGYDAADRLVALTNQPPGAGVPSSAYTIAYDAAGNRVLQTELQSALSPITFTNTFSYDGLNRLVSSRYGAGGALTNTYAANGNRLSERGVHPVGGGAVDRRYHYDLNPAWPATTFSGVNALTRIEDVAVPAQSVEYEYDANLNQVARHQNGAVQRFRFDARDQMIEATTAAGVTRFDYTADRVRGKKVGPGGVETRYLYDQAAVVQEYAGAADAHATRRKYEYGTGLLAMGTPSGAALAREFYQTDPMGSVVHLVDVGGAVLAGYQYDAWGGTRNGHGSSSNPRRFTGHYIDEETGLHYFGARYYDDEQARFLTQDPFQGHAATPPSLHRYQYAHGNPLRFTDPTGFAAETSEEADQWLAEAKAELAAIDQQFEADIAEQGADALAAYKAGPAVEAEMVRMAEERKRMLQEAGLTEADLRNPVMADRAKWGLALFQRDLEKWTVEGDGGEWRAYLAGVALGTAQVVVSPLELGAALGTLAGKLDIGADVTLWDWVAAAGDVFTAFEAVGTVGKVGASSLSRRAAETSAGSLSRGAVVREARRTVTGAAAEAARVADASAAALATQRAGRQMAREVSESRTLRAVGRTDSGLASLPMRQEDLADALRGHAGIATDSAGDVAATVVRIDPPTLSFHADFNAVVSRAAADTIYIRAVLEHNMAQVIMDPTLTALGKFRAAEPGAIRIRAGLDRATEINARYHEVAHMESFSNGKLGNWGGELFMEEFTAHLRGIQGEVLELGLEATQKTWIREVLEKHGYSGLVDSVYFRYRFDSTGTQRINWAQVVEALTRNGYPIP